MTQTTHRSGHARARVRPQAPDKRKPRPSRVSGSLGHAARHDAGPSLNSARSKRGLALYKSHARLIWPVELESYRVPSQNGAGIYQVCLKPGAEHCTCPDYARHGRRNQEEPGSFFCKHLYAALLCRIKHETPALRPGGSPPVLQNPRN